MGSKDSLLDNPGWRALTTEQAGFAQGNGQDRRYLPGILPFIRLEDRLIAKAGERMRLTGFPELSAICTHPDYTGHGYAQQLISILCRRQVTAGITPFLHVSLTNQRALRLYIHLGFRHRREIVFRRVRKIE